MSRLARFAKELRRRKVFRAAGAYLVMAFITMQVVDAVFPYLPLPDTAGTLVIVLLTLGFPITLGLAWTLEWTPSGIRRELPPADSEELRGGWPSDTRPREIRSDSIAVLPFENLSADSDNEYFSDGVTEDITASIARVRGLRVVSRTSVLRYKEGRRPLEVVARELGVATVVTGSVRRSGRRIRIVAQVVDARSESHLWAETYDRDLEDVFRVQSEVAAQVASAVRRELSPSDRSRIEARGTSDPEAYDLLLRARFLWNLRSEEAVADSVELLRKALERDPDFALAHVGLADAYTILGIYGAEAPQKVFPAAKAAADAALAVDATLGEAVASKACVSAVFDWDWSAAERGFKRAIELSPSYATAHQWYAINALAPQGRFADAMAELSRARELDPASFAISVSEGIVSLYARRYEEAASVLESVEERHPRFALVHYFLAQCHEGQGRLADALEHAEKAAHLSDRSPESLAAHGYVLGVAGHEDRAEAVLERLEALAGRRYVSRVLLAQVHLGLGRDDAAFEQLELARADRATDLVWLGVRPMYDRVRGDPHFSALISELGLPVA